MWKRDPGLVGALGVDFEGSLGDAAGAKVYRNGGCGRREHRQWCSTGERPVLS